MMDTVERHGEVVGFAQGLAQIRLERAAGCSSCGSRGTCASGQAAEQVIRMPLSEPAKVGDRVTLSMPSSSLTLAALLGYLLPPLSLLLGAILASNCFEGDAAAVLGAALGFAAGLLLVRRVSGAAFARGLAPLSCQSERDSDSHPYSQPQPDFHPGEHP